MKNQFEYGSKLLLTVVAVMIPLWFLPMPVTLEFGREVSFFLIIGAAFILWLLSLLTRGEIRYSSSFAYWACGLFVTIVGISTFLSKTPLLSLTFGEPLSERFSMLLLAVILMLTISGVCEKGKDIKRILFFLVYAAGIAGLFTFFQLAWGISLWTKISSYAQGSNFSIIGTMNGLALFFVIIFMMALGLIFSGTTLSLSAKARYSLIAILVILMLNLMMIHSHNAWIVLFGSLIFFSGLMIMHIRGRAGKTSNETAVRRKGLDARYSILLLLISFSVVMLMAKNSVLGSAKIPLEVAPSFMSTLSVAKQVFNEGPRALLFGSGPATFNLDWAHYRDPLINQTQFWAVSFAQGFSYMSTLVVTVGVLGSLCFILFIIVSLIVFLHHLFKYPHEEHTPLGISIFIGFFGIILAAILYPSTLTFLLMLFLFIGLLTALLAHPVPAMTHTAPIEESRDSVHLTFNDYPSGEESIDGEINHIAGLNEDKSSISGWWEITQRIIPFEGASLVFISSLLVVFFLSLSVGAMYLEVGKLRASLIQQRSVNLFNKGDIDGAIAGFEQAIIFEEKNFIHYIPLIQAQMEKIRGLIQRAAGGNNVQQEFQSAVSLTIQNSQKAVGFNPLSPLLRRLQGSLYELLIPFVPGSENFAFENYRKAIELDPLNPVYNIDLARAGLIAVDRLTLTIQQSNSAEKEQLIRIRNSALQEITTVLKKAVELKPDLADSHFLATQTALRLGNLAAAIESAEKVKLAAPFDIGVAFQLGLLYYQSGDINKAQVEFERAVAINNNYSNARYFLGLIYSQKGDMPRAIQQFEQIQMFNPDNKEVKRILENLHAAKPALTGIVPPAQPPEKRNEIPVKQSETR